MLRRNWPVILLGVVLLVGLVMPLATKASPPGFYIEVLLGGLNKVMSPVPAGMPV